MAFLLRRLRPLAVAATAGLLAVLTMPAGPASAGTSPGPPISGLACPDEQFPNAGTPRNSPYTPYEIPFTATLGQTDPTGLHIGGYLQIANGTVTATLGGPVQYDATTNEYYGSIYANVCGLVQLPNQSGVIPGNPYGNGSDSQANNNFDFTPQPISVELSITGVPGVSVTSAYAVADGLLTAQIDPTPAANGGLNVEFYGGAKSTANLGPALGDLLSEISSTPPPTLPPALSSALQNLLNSSGANTASCTIAIGNLLADGVPAGDLTSVTGLSYADATAPVHLTTQTSGNVTGQPVTGPITGSDATLVANEFPVGAIDPATVPAPGSSGTCSPTSAGLLNSLLGLPSPAGKNTFYAPSTFGVYTSS